MNSLADSIEAAASPESERLLCEGETKKQMRIKSVARQAGIAKNSLDSSMAPDNMEENTGKEGGKNANGTAAANDSSFSENVDFSQITENREKGLGFSSDEQGKTLEFHLPDEVIELIAENQSRTVILFFLRGIPTEPEFYKWEKINWENRGWEIETIRGLGKGYVSVSFKFAEHAQAVLQYGTWVICGQICYLQAWTFDFHPEGPSRSRYPMWLELPFLNLVFTPFLKDIVAQLGKVIWCKQSSDKFASLRVHPRVCVEVDLNKPLPETIKLYGPGFEIDQPVVYLNKPNACFFCRQEGHLIRDCPVRKNRSSLSPAQDSPAKFASKPVLQPKPIVKTTLPSSRQMNNNSPPSTFHSSFEPTGALHSSSTPTVMANASYKDAIMNDDWKIVRKRKEPSSPSSFSQPHLNVHVGRTSSELLRSSTRSLSPPHNSRQRSRSPSGGSIEKQINDQEVPISNRYGVLPQEENDSLDVSQ